MLLTVRPLIINTHLLKAYCIQDTTTRTIVEQWAKGCKKSNAYKRRTFYRELNVKQSNLTLQLEIAKGNIQVNCHFADEGTEAQQGKKKKDYLFPNVTCLITGRARTRALRRLVGNTVSCTCEFKIKQRGVKSISITYWLGYLKLFEFSVISFFICKGGILQYLLYRM